MTKLNLKVNGTTVEYEGNEKFLETRVLELLEAVKRSHNEDVKRTLLALNDELQQNLAALDGCFASISRLNEELDRRIKELNEKSMNHLERIEAFANNQAQLFAAAKEIQEMQMSFNLQYLQLQNSMQNENRAFTMVSNIMKTKHDTAKNSINNIR